MIPAVLEESLSVTAQPRVLPIQLPVDSSTCSSADWRQRVQGCDQLVAAAVASYNLNAHSTGVASVVRCVTFPGAV